MNLVWRSSLGLVFVLLLFFGWMITLPWFVWYLEPSDQKPHLFASSEAQSLVAPFTTNKATAIGVAQQLKLLTQERRPTQWLGAFGNTTKALLVDKVPLRPAALFVHTHQPTRDTSREQVAIVIAIEEADLLVSSSTDLENPWATPPSTATLSASHELALTAPGYVFGLMPPSLETHWNNALHAAFKFTQTKPNIIQYLRQFEMVQLKLGIAQPFIAVRGASDDFTAAAELWLQEEDRRSRLIESSFRLPDGTLGTERVPDAPRTLFGATPGICHRSVSAAIPLWLCQDGSVASLSSSHLEPSEIFSRESDQWHITLSRELIESICAATPQSVVCEFDGLIASGDTTGAQARLINFEHAL